MVTTVTDNTPKSINTSLFSLEKEINELKRQLNELKATHTKDQKEVTEQTAELNNFKKEFEGLSGKTGVISVNGMQGNVELTAKDVKALPIDTHIPNDQVNSDWNATEGVAQILNKPALKTVATSGKYSDLTDKPTIPSKTSELTNDSGYITGSYLPTSGGVMTGDINYKGSKGNHTMIKFIDNTTDAYGDGIRIGGGGATIIGGGESAEIWQSGTGISGGSEVMDVVNDNEVRIATNLQNGYANKKVWTFKSDGTVSTPSGSTLAEKSGIPTKTSQITNDSGFITKNADITGTAMMCQSKLTIANNNSSAAYYRIDSMIGINAEYVFMIQARAGELYIVSIGHGDGNNSAKPKIKKLLDVYSKVNGFAWSGSSLYLKISAYSHEVIITQIAGNGNPTLTSTKVTESEYSSATALTVE